MKQKLHIFMTLLLLLVCGGASFGQTFKKVTSESDLKAGDVIAIVNESANVALSTTQNGNNRGELKITLSNGEFSLVSGVQEISLEGESGKWSFNVGDGYLYAASSSGNHLKTQSAIDANAQATITFSSGNATIKFIGKNTRNTIKYNSSNNIFSCYASGQQTVQIYKKETQADKTSTKLSFGTDYDGKTVSTKVGEMLQTPATLTPAVSSATISYDSSDKTVAEIDEDGVVYAYKEGTTTITASYAGDDTYAGSSASYTLNVEDARTATTLTFPHASYTFTLGEQNGTAAIEDNVAVLTPADAQVGTPVVYSVEGTEGLAELIGNSVIVSTDIVGTAIVTATYPGNDNYKASEASYTIEVKVITGDEKFDFTKPELYGKGHSTSSDTSGDIAIGESISFGKIKMTVTKANGTNPTRFWTNDLRTYNGAQWILTADNGYVISNVKITTVTGSKGNIKIGEFGGRNVTVDFTGSGAKTMSAMTVTYAKLPTATLTTAASGFATYAADYDVNYSDAGLTAYAITLDEAAKTVKYTEATGVVPAGKAVLVKGEAQKEYTLAPATEEAADFTTDLLISDGKVTTADGLYYAFATVNGKSGFKVLADGLTIPAKKGYLKLSAANAKGFFELEGGEATGISEIEAETADDNAAIYNLAGQRVGKGYKGIAIKNGKKFVK